MKEGQVPSLFGFPSSTACGEGTGLEGQVKCACPSLSAFFVPAQAHPGSLTSPGCTEGPPQPLWGLVNKVQHH